MLPQPQAGPAPPTPERHLPVLTPTPPRGFCSPLIWGTRATSPSPATPTHRPAGVAFLQPGGGSAGHSQPPRFSFWSRSGRYWGLGGHRDNGGRGGGPAAPRLLRAEEGKGGKRHFFGDPRELGPSYSKIKRGPSAGTQGWGSRGGAGGAWAPPRCRGVGWEMERSEKNREGTPKK